MGITKHAANDGMGRKYNNYTTWVRVINVGYLQMPIKNIVEAYSLFIDSQLDRDLE